MRSSRRSAAIAPPSCCSTKPASCSSSLRAAFRPDIARPSPAIHPGARTSAMRCRSTFPMSQHADLDEGLKATVLGEGIRAAAFIPLVSDGALIGKFMAYFREPYTFTKDDLAVSLAIARQLAFSIQRSRTDAATARARSGAGRGTPCDAAAAGSEHRDGARSRCRRAVRKARRRREDSSCARISRACSSTSRISARAAS